MRAPHRGPLSVLVTAAVGVSVAVLAVAGLVWRPSDDARAKTPPATNTPTLALTAPTPAVFEFVDRDFHCHYFGSSAGGMTPRLKGVNAEGVGMPWCDR